MQTSNGFGALQQGAAIHCQFGNTSGALGPLIPKVGTPCKHVMERKLQWQLGCWWQAVCSGAPALLSIHATRGSGTMRRQRANAAVVMTLSRA